MHYDKIYFACWVLYPFVSLINVLRDMKWGRWFASVRFIKLHFTHELIPINVKLSTIISMHSLSLLELVLNTPWYKNVYHGVSCIIRVLFIILHEIYYILNCDLSKYISCTSRIAQYLNFRSLSLHLILGSETGYNW